ncbi:MAG TPA: hypothetical protein ENN07_00465 [candidate division Zixibacteria bacterium]|nr:hypothetical protein [candidate division Zixibacteria bacterium]
MRALFCPSLRGRPLLLGIIFFAIAGLARTDCVKVGQIIPDFLVVSGDDVELTRDDLDGKVTVLFYLSRCAQGVNRPLSSALTEFYHAQDEAVQSNVLRVAVMNATEARWPISQIWRKRLVEASKERGITVYGDWDGTMLADFGFIDEDSNILIIDSELRARYFAHGRIEGEEIDNIKALLMELIGEL